MHGSFAQPRTPSPIWTITTPRLVLACVAPTDRPCRRLAHRLRTRHETALEMRASSVDAGGYANWRLGATSKSSLQTAPPLDFDSLQREPTPTLTCRALSLYRVPRAARILSPRFSSAGVVTARPGLSSRHCGRPLLPRHRHAQAFFRRDVVVCVLGVLIEIDLHPVDLAGEPARVRRVIGADRRARFAADICRFVR